MGSSTVVNWLYFACGLVVAYLMACKLSEKQLKKWAERATRKAPNRTEFQRQLNVVGTYPLLWMLVLLLSLAWLGAIESLYEELPNKITGNWPTYQGTVVSYTSGYKGGRGYTDIQSDKDVKSFRIENVANGQEKKLIGQMIRVVHNGSKAYILEYEDAGSWVEVWNLSNCGKEDNVIAKTIGMNLLAGIVTCGFILRKIHRPCSNSYFRSKLLHNSVGFFLVLLSCINEIVLCKAVMGFPQNGVDEAFLMRSQLSMLILICINV
ncbi:hypothetical protein, partial [Allofournierella massiliensis]